MSSTISDRLAETSVPIDGVHAARWSPRSFDPDAVVDDDTLVRALEAARWAPSASNTQPWRFVVARRGTDTHARILTHLMGFNQVWAGNAGALILNVAMVRDAEGRTLRWAEYDLGQAVAHLSLQAQRDGLHTHQMGGIEVVGLREEFDLGEDVVPVSVTALGVVAGPERLPEKLRQRETAPRTREPLEGLLLAND